MKLTLSYSTIQCITQCININKFVTATTSKNISIMQKKALNAASTTQNNLRKGEEVLPIARAHYLQGLIEQIAGDVEKLKGEYTSSSIAYFQLICPLIGISIKLICPFHLSKPNCFSDS